MDARKVAGKLTIVPTPIGNLGDITLRSLEALRAADVVYAEDTRVTGKLLVALGIEGKRLERLDENTVAARADRVIERVQGGESVAYCSDAGTPGVSDPGLRLVRAAREAGVAIEVLPGATAAVTAYVASGFASGAFYFGGFLPRKDAARTQVLEGLRSLDAALVFYESPNRVTASLDVIARVFPYRDVVVCRELTKVHEEVTCGPAGDVAEAYRARDQVKGEIVIVVDGPGGMEGAANMNDALEVARTRAVELIRAGERSKSVAKALVAEFGIARNDAYAISLAASSLKDERDIGQTR